VELSPCEASVPKRDNFVRRAPQHRLAERFNRERQNRDAIAPDAIRQMAERKAHEDEAGAEAGHHVERASHK
jgi:hypothetical protein